MTIKNKLIKLINHPSVLRYYPVTKLSYIAFYDAIKAKSLYKKGFDTIIDVGANVGDYTYAYSKVFPNAKIYSFEPVPEAFMSLYRLKSNNISCFGLGLGSKNKKSIIKVVKDRSFLSTMNRIKFDNKLIIETPIILRRFESLNIKLKGNCLLKIDTEGYELEVLKGFGNLLSKVSLIQLEINFENETIGTSDFIKIVELLREFGFISFIQDNNRFDNRGRLVQSDLFFIRRYNDEGVVA